MKVFTGTDVLVDVGPLGQRGCAEVDLRLHRGSEAQESLGTCCALGLSGL